MIEPPIFNDPLSRNSKNYENKTQLKYEPEI